MNQIVDVYIVDEEYHFAENVSSILRIEGYNVRRFSDATEAFEFFTENRRDLRQSCLLVDVALAPGSDRNLFGPDKTDEYLTTGIILTQHIVKTCGGNKPRKIILYTAHYTTDLWGRIVEFCEADGYKSWQKRPDVEPEEIIGLIRDPEK